MEEQVHHRRGDEVDVLDGLAQNGHPFGQVVHLGGILGHHEELRPGIRYSQQNGAVLIAVGGELLGVVQRIGVGEHERLGAGRCGGRGRTAGQGQGGGGKRF